MHSFKGKADGKFVSEATCLIRANLYQETKRSFKLLSGAKE